MPRTQFARPQLGDPLRRLAGESDQVETHAEPAPVHRSLQVGAADDRAEHEADAVADQVLARLAVPHQHDGGCGHAATEGPVRRTPAPAGTATIGAAGGDLDAGSSSAIESARGSGSALPTAVRSEMEGGFGHSLADVRIHTDERAAKLSRTMSARAFTTGSDIFFGAGEFSPGTSDGKRVLAHEIAHTRQDAGVRRKMRGTAKALQDQGDTVTGRSAKSKVKGVLRKAVGGKTNWEKIVDAVKAYEKEESSLTADGKKRPDAKVFVPRISSLVGLLSTINTHITGWRTANKDAAAAAAYDNRQAAQLEDEESDVRTKANRRQAVNMLAPRVANEILMLNSPGGREWLESDTFSADLVTKDVGGDAGAQNAVLVKDYANASGGESRAVYKADHGFKQKRLGAGREVGFRQIDPNFGARSVALYRLDKLFGAGVTARAEFAVNNRPDGTSELGQVLHMAAGKKGGETAWGVDQDHTAQLNSTDPSAQAASLDDPVLQRGLNRLQLLDAISGQLDRHAGNYFVEVKDGAVTGVTGIDLDEAFGDKMDKVQAHAGRAQEFRGIPELIDMDMGLRIMEVTEKDVRDALYGLLSDEQIDSTVSRFKEVRAAVVQALQANALQEEWGSQSAAAGPNLANFKDKGYHDDLLNNGLKEIRVMVSRGAEARFRELVEDHYEWFDVPREVQDDLVARIVKWVSYDVGNIASKTHMASRHYERFVDLVLKTLISKFNTAQMVIMWQEAEDASTIGRTAWTPVNTEVTKLLPDLAKAFAK